MTATKETIINNESEIKKDDVFSFRFSEEESKKRFEPYHCFDAQLVATMSQSSGLILVDTYWHGSENKWFTPAQALTLGTLTFKCNKNDVTEIKDYERDYYNDDDIIVLSRQHGCYPIYAIRNDVKRSREKMLSVLKHRIEKSQAAINSANWNIERYNKSVIEVTVATDTDLDKIYI